MTHRSLVTRGTSKSLTGLLTLFALNQNALFPTFNDLPRCKNICGWVSLHKRFANSYS
jgi:hypothetical protein